MTTPATTLFADLTPATAPNTAKPLLDATAGIFGFVPNLAVAMSADPAALEGYLSALHAFGHTSALSPIEQQLVLITASVANEADYSVAVHASVAAKLGGDGALVHAAMAGQRSPIRDSPPCNASPSP
jgi:AhpD family alkylhydroperoxidase